MKFEKVKAKDLKVGDVILNGKARGEKVESIEPTMFGYALLITVEGVTGYYEKRDNVTLVVG